MKWGLTHEPWPLPPWTKYEEVLIRVYNEAWAVAMTDMLICGECGVEIDGSGEEVVVRRIPPAELAEAKRRNPFGVVWYKAGGL